jgi:hypothetical protein
MIPPAPCKNVLWHKNPGSEVLMYTCCACKREVGGMFFNWVYLSRYAFCSECKWRTDVISSKHKAGEVATNADIIWGEKK